MYNVRDKKVEELPPGWERELMSSWRDMILEANQNRAIFKKSIAKLEESCKKMS